MTDSKTAIKKRLILARGHQCENCTNRLWFELPITLELEHIDGNNSNNSEDNLLLLCPNCHAQTKTWRRAKSSFEEKPKHKCPICNEPKTDRSTACLKCFQTKRNEHRAVLDIEYDKFCACGQGIWRTSTKCVKCAHLDKHIIEWPSVRDLLVRLRDNREPYTSVAKSLGISDNAVRNFLRRNNIDPKTFKALVQGEQNPPGDRYEARH